MAKIALFIVLVSMIMIHSAQVVVSDNEPSAAPIADVVAVAGPVSGSESSPALAPAPAPTPETTTKVEVITSIVGKGAFGEVDWEVTFSRVLLDREKNMLSDLIIIVEVAKITPGQTY
ncbi:hypothetical protein V6N13_069438 [Hibiscus sabdariffa]